MARSLGNSKYFATGKVSYVLQHKFHHDHNSSQRHNSNSSIPLLKKKLAGYSEEELQEYHQIGNHEIDFDEFCDVMKRLNAKKCSWNEVIRECFASLGENSGSPFLPLNCGIFSLPNIDE
uniref:EF-hand domain-containing protein n=1 Tax=Parascaris equorum TaxID=6256 RepID=A0A914RN88_PAREQ